MIKKHFIYSFIFALIFFLYLCHTLTIYTDSGDLSLYFRTYTSGLSYSFSNPQTVFDLVLKLSSNLFSFRLFIILLSAFFSFIYFRYSFRYFSSYSLSSACLIVFLFLYFLVLKTNFVTTISQGFLYLYLFSFLLFLRSFRANLMISTLGCFIHPVSFAFILASFAKFIKTKFLHSMLIASSVLYIFNCTPPVPSFVANSSYIFKALSVDAALINYDIGFSLPKLIFTLLPILLIYINPVRSIRHKILNSYVYKAFLIVVILGLLMSQFPYNDRILSLAWIFIPLFIAPLGLVLNVRYDLITHEQS